VNNPVPPSDRGVNDTEVMLVSLEVDVVQLRPDVTQQISCRPMDLDPRIEPPENLTKDALGFGGLRDHEPTEPVHLRCRLIIMRITGIFRVEHVPDRRPRVDAL
jgi:hypothetical protein